MFHSDKTPLDKMKKVFHGIFCEGVLTVPELAAGKANKLHKKQGVQTVSLLC